MGLAIICLCAGCGSLGPLPPVDLTNPDWTVLQGQAVWKAKRNKAGLAGDLLVATHPDGRCLVHFSKPPLALISAQATRDCWRIDFISKRRVVSGKGSPPDRYGWLQLPRALTGDPLGAGWSYRKGVVDRFRLENEQTGELLEGYLTR